MSFTRQQPKRALYFQLNFFLDLLCFQLTLLSRFRSYSLKEVPPPVLFPPPFRFSFLLQFFSLPILNCYRCNTTRNRRNWTLTNESWPLTGNDLKRCTTESSNAVWAGKGQELMQNSVPVRGGIWGGVAGTKASMKMLFKCNKQTWAGAGISESDALCRH